VRWRNAPGRLVGGLRTASRRTAALASLGSLALGGACHETFTTLAGAPSSSAHTDQLLAAINARVSDPWRDARYDTARVKIANAAFLPSRVWEDTTVWSFSTASRRTTLVSGRLMGGRYRLEAVRALPPIAQPGDSRHTINLTRLAGDEYAWDTDVGFGIGGITAAEAGRLVAGLFTASGRSEEQIRTDYRATVPRAAAALGQLFHVDSIRTVTLADHSTLVTYAVTLTPDGLAPRYPDFAQYMHRYGESTAMHWTITDRLGATYLECALTRGRMLLRVRSLGGAMLPIAPMAVARPLPDSLYLNGEFTIKVRRFTVGFREYHAELTIIRTPRERAWALVSRREPEWVLPLITERILKTPLRRPFQGSGALFRVGVREDSATGETLLLRRMHLEVQESTILRFIGRLGATAVGDFTGKAERQQYAWLHEVFAGLAADAKLVAIVDSSTVVRARPQ